MDGVFWHPKPSSIFSTKEDPGIWPNIFHLYLHFPEKNSLSHFGPWNNSSHLKTVHSKRKRSYSNHPFSGAMSVSFGVFWIFPTTICTPPKVWSLEVNLVPFPETTQLKSYQILGAVKAVGPWRKSPPQSDARAAKLALETNGWIDESHPAGSCFLGGKGNTDVRILKLKYGNT